jgi:hypothetical protein
VVALLLAACSTREQAERVEELAEDTALPAAATAPPVVLGDLLLIPGGRAGAVHPGATEDSLALAYGRDQVRVERCAMGEGESEPCLVLFPHDSTRRLQVHLADTAALRTPRFVSLRGTVSQWRTPEGVTAGMPLEAVEALNGGPFRIHGFGWDYAGMFADWQGGRLGAQYGEFLRTWIAVDETVFSGGEYNELLTDGIFRTDHPPLRRLSPRVQMVEVFFAPPR